MLNRKVLIGELASEEVTSDPFSKLSGRESMEALIDLGLISSVRLSALAFKSFLQPISAPPPDDLGDGEASRLRAPSTLTRCL